jgi:coenzyme F420-0:L-glutamate ligase/coenzyme F420-1:gamma-L-glutamate ligase
MDITKEIKIFGLEDIPLVKKGDNIPNLILESIKKKELHIRDGDILVIAQTLISKSNGRTRNLNEIECNEKAMKLHKTYSAKSRSQGLPLKDPRLIQAILEESQDIIKAEHVLITETKHGFICADAGIDKSNVEGKDTISLLPENPDKDAENIRITIKEKTSKDIGVIISDSFGRPFRIGAVGVAIGVSGINPILDMRGKEDLFGYELQSTMIAQVDSLASAAQLVMGEANEGIPAVLIRGYKFNLNKEAKIESILRKKELDLFREPIKENLINVMKNRRSYKYEFEKKKVERKTVEECIEIARWAPSAHNGQHWRYTILENNDIRKTLIDKMNQKLKDDLKKEGKGVDFINFKIRKTRDKFIEAPLLILLCLDKRALETYTDKERIFNEFILGVQSISCSASYLLLALEIKKLAACWYCAPLFAKDEVRTILNLPETYVPMAFFAVGYPLKNINAPSRKELHEVIFDPKI